MKEKIENFIMKFSYREIRRRKMQAFKWRLETLRLMEKEELEGYSVREIAGILGVTESAVKNRLSRARAKLKNELEQENSYGMES